MQTMKRRGRPKGTGENDAAYLDRVADLLAADQTLKPRAAMLRTIRSRGDLPSKDSAMLRRWQRKWKEHEAALMQSARARAVERAKSVEAQKPKDWQASMMELASIVGQSPALRLAAELQTTPMMKEMQRFHDLMRTYQPPPAVQDFIDKLNSPAMRGVEESLKRLLPSPAEQSFIDRLLIPPAAAWLESPALKEAMKFAASPAGRSILGGWPPR